jgi:alcohol dehydrogenase class IV
VRKFIHLGQPMRVVFGAASLAYLEREIDLLGSKRALILSTPDQAGLAAMVADRLGARAAGVFARAVMHVPIETAREAREEASRLDADCAIAIGGGSTVGLGKAIALESGLPILAVPTTYAGSEMTPIYGITEAGLKKTGRDPRVLPRTVIYDPQLSALYGAWLCGTVLGNVGMALHHKLCHTLAAASSCPMRKSTRWCCRTRSPSTRTPRRKPCGGSRARSARKEHRALPRECSTQRKRTVQRLHFATSACTKATSTVLPTSP